MTAPRLSLSDFLDALGDVEDAMRLTAEAIFGMERTTIERIFDGLTRRGHTSAADPFVRAAIRAIVEAYTEPEGAYHMEWLERYGALIGDAVSVGQDRLAAQLPGGAPPASIAFDFTLRNPRVLRAIDDRTERLASLVTETTATRVAEAARTAYQEGTGVRELAKAIVDEDGVLGPVVSKARARAIARTEAVGAMVRGEYVTALESGVFTHKSWLGSGNRRDPRDWHQAMDGERVPIRAKFSNGLLHPHDEDAPAGEVVNCGCNCEYHVE